MFSKIQTALSIRLNSQAETPTGKRDGTKVSHAGLSTTVSGRV